MTLYNVNIKLPNRQSVGRSELPPENIQCAICTEKRIIHRCHIIPSEFSGSNYETNVIYLCPNHHYIFDRAKLSKNEFSKINVDDKADDSKQFFFEVRKKQHEMYWKYRVEQRRGCGCGSTEFHFDAFKDGDYVVPCLICEKVW